MQKKFLYGALIPGLFFQAIGAYLYFVLLTGTGWSGIAYAITKVLVLCWPILWFWFGLRPQKEKHVDTKASCLLGIGSGMLILGAMIGLFFLLESHFSNVKPLIETKLIDYKITTPQIYIIVFLLYSFVHAFIEEYYWRWFLFRGFNKFFSPFATAIISSIGFGLHHYIVIGQYLPWVMTAFLGTCVIVGGLLWCWIYYKTRSFLGAWISHIFVDLGIFSIGYFLLWG